MLGMRGSVNYRETLTDRLEWSPSVQALRMLRPTSTQTHNPARSIPEPGAWGTDVEPVMASRRFILLSESLEEHLLIQLI